MCARGKSKCHFGHPVLMNDTSDWVQGGDTKFISEIYVHEHVSVEHQIQRMDIPKLVPTSTLLLRVGPRSRLLPDRMNLNLGFLSEPVDTWPSIPDFTRLKNFLTKVPSVNDECERQCKRASDYASLFSKKEEDYQNILLCVGDALEALPSRKLKRDLVAAFDS